MRMMALAEIVLDFDLYPRQQIDSQHVGAMCEAVRAGVKLPPITIDKKSKRATDGFHRFRRAERMKEDTIAVVEKTYLNDAAMFLDAVRMNASHGHNLTPFDRAHCIILAGKLSVNDKEIAGALSFTVEKVNELRVSKTATAGKLSVATPIKRTIRHMAGRKLNACQVEANKKLGGMGQKFYLNQVLVLIDSGLLDTSDERLMELLRELGEKIKQII